MKATCPKDPTHKRFITVAHVTEDWVVDETGDFLEVFDTGGDTEVVCPPQPDNHWTCKECGHEAKVER
jgi:hypothetical protein